ncbi:MAG: hypothetical protein K0R28_4984 [Paenibacillus sp.]|nr:hypothetical protein [Paenibacillus sp.]
MVQNRLSQSASHVQRKFDADFLNNKIGLLDGNRDAVKSPNEAENEDILHRHDELRNLLEVTKKTLEQEVSADEEHAEPEADWTQLNAIVTQAKSLLDFIELTEASKRYKTLIRKQLPELVKEAFPALFAQAESLFGKEAEQSGDAVKGLAAAKSRVRSSVPNAESAAMDAMNIIGFRQKLNFTGKQYAESEEGPFIVQNVMARGDMYHVKAVLGLFPGLKVVLTGVPASESALDKKSDKEIAAAKLWNQACDMARYYNAEERVFYTGEKVKEQSASELKVFEAFQKGEAVDKGLKISVGGCSSLIGMYMTDARKGGKETESRNSLAAAVAPSPNDKELKDDKRASEEEMIEALMEMGFQEGPEYAIINFRNSGHKTQERKLKDAPLPVHKKKVYEKYDPRSESKEGNHPELDTGTVGVEQLAAIAVDKGMIPVFMGEEPASAANQQPNLIKYWEREFKGKRLCRGGREAEAFFLRVLANRFNVKAISMRSGVTDQMAFVGIPVLSIDTDTYHQPIAPFEKSGLEVSDMIANSWAREGKFEAAFGRAYGRAFLQEGRKLKHSAEGGENQLDEEYADGKWKGEFAKHDLANINDAVEFYFMQEQGGVRHHTHPLHPDRLAETESKPGGLTSLSRTLGGKLDTNMNDFVVLDEAASLLKTGKREDVEQAIRQLNSFITYLQHIIFNEWETGSGSSGFPDYLKRKMGELITFVEQAEARVPAESDTLEAELADLKKQLAVIKSVLEKMERERRGL